MGKEKKAAKQHRVSVNDLKDSDLIDNDPGGAVVVRELANEAEAFLRSFKWCRGVKHLYFDRGFSKVAVFYAEIECEPSADPNVWLVVGDIPPAYIEASTNTNGAMALEGYVHEMDRWVHAVEHGTNVQKLIPVLRRDSLEPIEPSLEFAKMLGGRLEFIRKRLLPRWKSELSEATEFED